MGLWMGCFRLLLHLGMLNRLQNRQKFLKWLGPYWTSRLRLRWRLLWKKLSQNPLILCWFQP